MKLKKSISVGNGVIVPAGTKLDFGVEGFTKYKGITVYQRYIPKAAIESDTVAEEEQPNNSYDSEKKWKDFDAIEAGDKGYDSYGKAITILGKGIGQSGFDDLDKEFGNASGLSFNDIVQGYSDEEIKDLQFIAYSTDEDGAVMISLYGQDFAAAVESEDIAIPFEDVEPGDTAVNAEGKAFKVYSKGHGKVWFEEVKEAQDLEIEFPELPEGVEDNDVNFVYGAYENGPKSIELYGAAGVRVNKLPEND